MLDDAFFRAIAVDPDDPFMFMDAMVEVYSALRRSGYLISGCRCSEGRFSLSLVSERGQTRHLLLQVSRLGATENEASYRVEVKGRSSEPTVSDRSSLPIAAIDVIREACES